MLTLIENGLVYAPERRQRLPVLLVGEKIARIGEVDRRALEATGLDLQVIDASDCVVTPGLIDPHQHLIGGSGERGFSSQTPEISLAEIVAAGITTVVGCLGVDTTTKTMPALLAKAKALAEEGLTAYLWSGGYTVPPVTLTGSLRTDLLFIAEVIGAGEVAISDHRASEPRLSELARLVSETYVGGMLSRKAGLTHFHVGDHPDGLRPLRALLRKYAVQPEWLYPTHVERQRKLLREAAAFSRLGAFVDIDTMEEDLPQQLQLFLDDQGDPRQLTVSSDAAISSPCTLYDQIRACVLDHRYPLEKALSLVTVNPARALKLHQKGRLQPGFDADLLVLRRDSLEIRHVFARGRHLLRQGRLMMKDRLRKRPKPAKE
ncbi:MAG TPA: amidohydrolase family protein [Blastocatellia bacterium]|nr:amidohydrolase family protein [Blastocatellia bacterium]